MQEKSRSTVLFLLNSEIHSEKWKQLARVDNNISPQKLTRSSAFSALALWKNYIWSTNSDNSYSLMMLKSISSKKSLGCSIGNATQEKIEILQLCQKSFVMDSHTKEDKKSNSKAKTHECEFCKKIFTQNNNLQKHMRIHTGENIPYQVVKV